MWLLAEQAEQLQCSSLWDCQVHLLQAWLSAAVVAESLSLRCRIVRAFLIEEQKIVKRVLKLQQRKAK